MGQAPGTAATVLFTVANQTVVVVRDIEVFNDSNVVSSFGFQIVGHSRFFTNAALATFTWQQWQGRVVMNPGQQLEIFVNTASPTDVIVSGYTLLG